MSIEKVKARPGRPSKFTEDIKKEIIERLTNGESARAICRDKHMPAWANFCKFKRENKEFRDQYEIAWADGFTAWETKCLDVAYDDSRDYQPDGKGGVKSDNTSVNRDRLKIDTMKWIMCKRLPHIYGDKVQTEQTVKLEVEYVDRPAAENTEAWVARVQKQIQQRAKDSVH